jgi:hypothetical protein
MVLQWILMLLWILEGLLSYLVTTFARLCMLPNVHKVGLCIGQSACTRLDHVLGKAHPGFYHDRLCKLQPPYPMCTRLDHVLGKAHPGLYHDVMCTSEMDHHGHFVALTKIIIPDIYPKRSVQLIYIK